jgi:hypothetical protein
MGNSSSRPFSSLRIPICGSPYGSADEIDKESLGALASAFSRAGAGQGEQTSERNALPEYRQGFAAFAYKVDRLGEEVSGGLKLISKTESCI